MAETGIDIHFFQTSHFTDCKVDFFEVIRSFYIIVSRIRGSVALLRGCCEALLRHNSCRVDLQFIDQLGRLQFPASFTQQLESLSQLKPKLCALDFQEPKIKSYALLATNKCELIENEVQQLSLAVVECNSLCQEIISSQSLIDRLLFLVGRLKEKASNVLNIIAKAEDDVLLYGIQEGST